EDPAVALAHRRGLQARRIRTGARLRKRPGAERLAGGELGQPTLLLLLVAEPPDVVGAQAVVRGHRQRERAVVAGDLLDHGGDAQRAQADAAVFLRHGHAEQAELPELADGLAGEGLRLVPRAGVGLDLRLTEIADGVAQRNERSEEGREGSELTSRRAQDANRQST